MTSPAPTLQDIQVARQRLQGHLNETPMEGAPRLSELLGCKIRLKLESQQFTGSFKERGALNTLLSLEPAEIQAGVIAMSAGNHAQAVACHATRLGIKATIVMPATTPYTKVERTQTLGGRVVLVGETLSDAAEHARKLANDEGLTFIHPYDDPRVIAGQGTVALEMLEAAPDLDTLVVPVGGGGLISGIAIAAKALRPDIMIIGVESALYPSMRQSLAGQPISCSGATLADGIAVKAPGALTQAVIEQHVARITEVSEARLEEAVYRLATMQKLVVEGAGAAALATMLDNPAVFANRNVALVVSGGNIDARILAQVLMRGLVLEGRIVRLRIGITDAPGILARVARLLGDGGANIVEVHHQRLFHDVPVKMAEIDVVLETRDRPHVEQLIARMIEAGFPTELMMDVS